MKLRNVLIAFITVFVVFCAVDLYAQPSDGQCPKGKGPGRDMIQELTEKLDLTEDQQAKLKEHCKGMWGGKKGGPPDFVEDLGLTEDQQTRLEAHRQKHMEEMDKAREKMKTKKEELRKALDSVDADRATVEKLVTELNSAFATMTHVRVNGILEIKEILTKEQFEKFQQGHKKHRGMMGRKMHGRGGWGPGMEDGEEDRPEM